MSDNNLLHEKLIGAALPWLALIVAVLLASAAAYFSILGLTTVFVGAIVPVAIMASLIEAGKLIGVSWVYRHYKIVSRWLTTIIIVPVIVAMLVTSLGIFGFLARAYTEHAADNQHIEIEVERLDNRIDGLVERRDRAQSNLTQINESLNTLIEYDRISGPDGYRAVRENNEDTINELENIIEEAENRTSELRQNRLDLQRDLSVAEAEMGPIRFVAEMIWGDDNARENYDRAVRILILTLVFIFDPFAIALLVAANHSLMIRSRQKADANNDSGTSPPTGGNVAPDPEPLEPKPSAGVEEPIEENDTEDAVDRVTEPEEPEEPRKESLMIESKGVIKFIPKTKYTIHDRLTALIKKSHGVLSFLDTKTKIKYKNNDY